MVKCKISVDWAGDGGGKLKNGYGSLGWGDSLALKSSQILSSVLGQD